MDFSAKSLSVPAPRLFGRTSTSLVLSTYSRYRFKENFRDRVNQLLKAYPIRARIGNASSIQYDSALSCPVIIAIPIKIMTTPAAW